jgi:hypothetical protein
MAPGCASSACASAAANHAMASAAGNPAINATMKALSAQAGASNAGKAIEAP